MKPLDSDVVDTLPASMDDAVNFLAFMVELIVNQSQKHDALDIVLERW